MRPYTTINIGRDTHKMLRIAAATRGTNVKSLVEKIVSEALKKER